MKSYQAIAEGFGGISLLAAMVRDAMARISVVVQLNFILTKEMLLLFKGFLRIFHGLLPMNIFPVNVKLPFKSPNLFTFSLHIFIISFKINSKIKIVKEIGVNLKDILQFPWHLLDNSPNLQANSFEYVKISSNILAKIKWPGQKVYFFEKRCPN